MLYLLDTNKAIALRLLAQYKHLSEVKQNVSEREATKVMLNDVFSPLSKTLN